MPFNSVLPYTSLYVPCATDQAAVEYKSCLKDTECQGKRESPPDLADGGVVRVPLVIEGEAPRQQLMSHDAC